MVARCRHTFDQRITCGISIRPIYLLDRSIHLHRSRSMKELRGIAKGLKWTTPVIASFRTSF
jgi:hypothetical protein